MGSVRWWVLALALGACGGSNKDDANNAPGKDKNPDPDDIVCEAGFAPDSGGNCLDVNECAESQPCKNSGLCFDFDGGYQCACVPGFTGEDCQRSGPRSDLRAAEVVPLAHQLPDVMSWPHLKDIDGNGYADLVYWSSGSHAGAIVALDDGNGGFLAPVELDVCGQDDFLVSSATVADLDGDGLLDIRCHDRTGTNANGSVYTEDLALFDGTAGAFAVPTHNSVTVDHHDLNPMVVADLNGDGRVDILNGNRAFLSDANGSVSTMVEEALVPLADESKLNCSPPLATASGRMS